MNLVTLSGAQLVTSTQSDYLLKFINLCMSTCIPNQVGLPTSSSSQNVQS